MQTITVDHDFRSKPIDLGSKDLQSESHALSFIEQRFGLLNQYEWSDGTKTIALPGNTIPISRNDASIDQSYPNTLNVNGKRPKFDQATIVKLNKGRKPKLSRTSRLSKFIDRVRALSSFNDASHRGMKVQLNSVQLDFEQLKSLRKRWH